MSEFQGYTHDCWWASALMAAHALAPGAWPLTGAVLDRLVADAIAQGQTTDREGSARYDQVIRMLDHWGWHYTPARPYTGYIIGEADLKSVLDAALARGKPVMLALGNGQALSGDERGLAGHAIAVLKPGYQCGDGDNPASRNGWLNLYPLAMLAAAQPISAIVLEGVPGMSWSVETDAQGHTTGGRDTAGHTCGAGDIEYIQSHGLAGVDGRASESYYDTNHSYLLLSNGEVVRAVHNQDDTWTIDDDAAAVVADLRARLDAASAASTTSSAGGATPRQLAADQAMQAILLALHAYAQASGVDV